MGRKFYFKQKINYKKIKSSYSFQTLIFRDFIFIKSSQIFESFKNFFFFLFKEELLFFQIFIK